MSNPYSDRMSEIARLRTQRMVIDLQIRNEIAKAWRLAPAGNLETFSQALGLPVEDVREILGAQGIVVRTQV